MANEDKPWLDDPIIRPAVSPESVAPRRVAEPDDRSASRDAESPLPTPPSKPDGRPSGQSLDQALAGIQAPNIGSVSPAVADAGNRVVKAGVEGYQAVPSTQPVRDIVTRYGGIAAPLINPLIYGAGGILAAGAGAYRGAQQLGVEAISPILGPQAARDIVSIPDAFVGSPGSGWNLPRQPPNRLAPQPGPQFVSERMAPPREPGATNLDRMTQLIRHDDAELRGEGPQVQPQRGVTEPEAGAAPPPIAAPVPPDPRTAAGAKEIAGSYYRLADERGGTLTPQFTDRFVDNVTKTLPQTEAGRVVAGESETAALAKRLEDLRGKGTTLQGAQEIDEGLTGLIDKQWSPTGMSKEGLRLAEIQRGFRDQIMNAAEGDIQGGAAGFEALRSGRQAWSQAMKLRDLEAIQRRAEMTEQPSTSIRTQVRTLLGNAKKSRGYSPAEIAALEDAAQRGALGGAMHVFGSRLVPIVAGAFGLSSGGLGGLLLGAPAALAVSGGARSVATGLQARRLGRAADVVSRSVPRNPLGP